MSAQTSNVLRENTTINLTDAVTMIVEESPFALELTSSVLAGLGIRSRCICQTPDEAKSILAERVVDLVLVNCELPGIGGYGLVKWLRRSAVEVNAFVPVIMTATHMRPSSLTLVRDCGASLVLIKPFSPRTLLSRILWAARDLRPFIELTDYFGPDRRVRDVPFLGGDRRVAGAQTITRPSQTQGEAP